MSYPRKLRVGKQWLDASDRGGWARAMKALSKLHHPHGIHFDGWLDKKFSWGSSRGDRNYDPMAYGEPFVGVIHATPETPEQFRLSNPSLPEVLNGAQWRNSLPLCRGLFVLARRTRDWLAERVPVPVSALRLPVAPVERGFSMERYLASPRIVHLGWWLRRFASFYELYLPGVRKELLGVSVGTARGMHEAQLQDVPKELWPTATILPHLSREEYDDVLASSVVFLHFHDMGGSNAISECIARNTPVLVNPVPAAVEYLGESYPLYFDSVKEAAAKAQDVGALTAAHEYLRRLPKGWLSARMFVRSVATSQVYRALPEPEKHP